MRRLLLAILLLALVLLPATTLAQNIDQPSDPLFADQWALRHVGAQCAWARTIGSPSVTVAVIDSGVDLNHPDLVGRLRTDGRDFVDGDDDPSDENGHGTNVAGIIAATLDNGEGGAGLAPGVQILPVRVMNRRGAGSDRAIARGVRFAADQGAQVINLSLGATLTIDADSVSQQVTNAIRYAQEKGALVVVAAGNDFLPLENAIVGDNPDVLVVAATDDGDRKAPFSNSGPWVGIAAPGVHILSTMPTYEVFLTSDAVPRDERFQQNYDYMSGTSQATPFVSALAALLFSARRDWDARRVAQEIKDHAVDISRENAALAEQHYLGAGRIDACQSLGAVPGVAPASGNGAPTAGAGADATRLRGDLLLIAGVLACGAALLFVVMVFALVRATRRPRAGAAAVPVYVPQQSTPRSGTAPPPPGRATPPPPYQQSANWGSLAVIAGSAQPRAYPLAGAGALIGRGEDCAVLLLGDGTISRRHAIVRNDGRQITIEDAGSAHGTYLGGQRVAGPVPLRRGDIIQVGQTLLRFQ
jgi:thermitase